MQVQIALHTALTIFIGVSAQLSNNRRSHVFIYLWWEEHLQYILVHLRNNFSTERHTHIYLITYLAMKGGQIFRCVGIHGGNIMVVICINIWHGIIFKICKRISFKDDGLYSESTGCSRKRGVLTRFPIDLAEGLQ